MENELDLAVFVEQAEYIQPENFGKWVVAHPQENIIIKKLISPGAKLITGPRGCGKTTILLKSLHIAKSKGVLAAYVNFKTSLKLEPLYKKNVNAPYWFLQWMILKVYDGLYDQISNNAKKGNMELGLSRDEIKKSMRAIENGTLEKIKESSLRNLDDLQHDIERILNYYSLNRCVLLLDDAAHAFSHEQQEDFFDFFRKIKNRLIAPKAAIYPGVTSFSASFHIGHDAEEISIWINPDKDDYVEFMLNLIERRLPHDTFEKLSNNLVLLKLLIYSANGIPRYFLNMINTIVCGDENESNGYMETIKFDKKSVLKAVEKSYLNTRGIYGSLKTKLPIYKSFIEKGEVFFDEIINIIKKYNKGNEIEKQSTTIGIKRPIEPEIAKVLGFLEYAGLVTPSGDSKRGENQIYEIFSLNNAAIIDRNVFFGSSSINLANYVTTFESRLGRYYPRVTTETILKSRDVSNLFQLSLPPCQKCKTPRINEDAKFCINCGAELKSISIFEEIINQDIAVLPLTTWRISSIKSNSKIRKIKDILMDHDRTELRGVPMIGETWAARIANYAEEQIA